MDSTRFEVPHFIIFFILSKYLFNKTLFNILINTAIYETRAQLKGVFHTSRESLNSLFALSCHNKSEYVVQY